MSSENDGHFISTSMCSIRIFLSSDAIENDRCYFAVLWVLKCMAFNPVQPIRNPKAWFHKFLNQSLCFGLRPHYLSPLQLISWFHDCTIIQILCNVMSMPLEVATIVTSESACWLLIAWCLFGISGPFYWHGLTLIACPEKYGVELLFHSQTSTAASLKFGNR